MNKLEKFKIGDKIYVYWIFYNDLFRDEWIIKDTTIRTHEEIEYIIAENRDKLQKMIAIYDNGELYEIMDNEDDRLYIETIITDYPFNKLYVDEIED